ncbi:hypothetical protein FOA52_010990 [Chlamydomonas sp. UWO 241]|nr:hypothetical protein FOA52_010990 [Chlamydomonas sp. UWO 241]
MALQLSASRHSVASVASAFFCSAGRAATPSFRTSFLSSRRGSGGMMCGRVCLRTCKVEGTNMVASLCRSSECSGVQTPYGVVCQCTGLVCQVSTHHLRAARDVETTTTARREGGGLGRRT